MKIFDSYKSSLKNPQVEEILDLIVFRPLAFLLVLVLVRLPVTPNQITFLAMISGILSGYLYSFGDPQSFVFGALLYGLSNVLDCSDGMIARIKHNGTKIGRIIDGFVDYIVSISVYIGLAIGLKNSMIELPYSAWILIIAAGLSAAMHAVIFDYYRNQFLAIAIGKVNTIQTEIDEFTTELNRLQTEKTKLFDQFLIRLYLAYCKLQSGSSKPKKVHYDSKTYFKSNKLLLRLWSLIGSTSHISILIIASFIYNPLLFFYYVIIFGNSWMVFLWLIQIYTNKRIAVLND